MNSLFSRRQMLSSASTGFGMAALAGLMQAETPMVHRAKRIAPKARSVIFCYMSGGVSHLDSFDPKPLLEKYAGKPMPGEVKKTQFNNNGTVQPAHWDVIIAVAGHTLPINLVLVCEGEEEIGSPVSYTHLTLPTSDLV